MVVGARSMPGNRYDGHTLAEALEQAAILSDVSPEVAIADRGYKGGFNRSSQHWIIEQILGTRPKLPQASSSQGFFGALRSTC